MDLIPYLSAVILISTVATILLAVISYAAFKLRDKRRPKVDPDDVPTFFHRYRTGDELDGSSDFPDPGSTDGDGRDPDDGAGHHEEGAELVGPQSPHALSSDPMEPHRSSSSSSLSSSSASRGFDTFVSEAIFPASRTRIRSAC